MIALVLNEHQFYIKLVIYCVKIVIGGENQMLIEALIYVGLLLSICAIGSCLITFIQLRNKK